MNFKHFFNYVPGFRSGEKMNMIIASIYYIFFIAIFILSLLLSSGKGAHACLSALLMPFMIFSFMDYYANK
ncbi:hypothetical protein [Clostridium hydrogenum]|uniref:hypothetical protein n=1 Tax=Clostridium hydrogenum TaxID=2855764 RepID=UPI001F48F4B7|nr:hypothetical protein [Clostridium hydrogenum]